MTVVAIDPGISTGIAIHSDQYSTVVITDPKKIWDILVSHEPEVVCIENFASGGLISKYGQETIRLVGAVELACYIKGIKLVLQMPIERKPFIPIARQMLRQLGKIVISHEVDALSHLLLYEHRVANGTLEQINRTRRNTYK